MLRTNGRSWFHCLPARALALGVLLTSTNALAYSEWFDTTAADRKAAGYPIAKRGDVTWAYANRSANAVCQMWGFEAGLYVGHQSGELMGVHCFRGFPWRDVTNAELYSTPGWGNMSTSSAPLDKQNSFWSAYAANILCAGTGFFNGHQDRYNGLTGLHCVPEEEVADVYVYSNDPRFGFPSGFTGNAWALPWWRANIAAHDVCNYYGYRTGLLNGMLATGSVDYTRLQFSCWN